MLPMEEFDLPIVPILGLLLPLNRFPIIPEIMVGLREVEIVWSTG